MRRCRPRRSTYGQRRGDFIPPSIYLFVVDAKLRLEMGAERMKGAGGGVRAGGYREE